MIVGMAEVKHEFNPAYYKNHTHVAPLGLCWFIGFVKTYENLYIALPLECGD